MKAMNLVKLLKDHEEVKIGSHGILVEAGQTKSKILFFNDNNIGDYVVCDVANQDFAMDKEVLPDKIKAELLSKISTVQNTFASANIKEYDTVELIVEDEKYTQYGMHKGDLGVVMSSEIVQNSMVVDFSTIDNHGNVHGDCISVNIVDMKVVL